MEWIEPVINRGNADVVRKTNKGFLNFSDLNRIENDEKFISKKLKITIEAKTNWVTKQLQ